MAAGTIYSYPESFRANKALIAAQFSGADVKLAANFKFGETNTTADYLKKFPLGKVPAYEGKDGFCLTETNAIAYYVSNSQLRGDDPKQEALVAQWISFSDNEITPAACSWTFPCLGITQFNKQETVKAKQQIQKVLDRLNNHLLTRTYMVGERVTLADISLVCNLRGLYELVLDPAFRKSYGNVNRWFTTLINQPQFKAVLGSVQLASKMATFDAKKYQEIHGGAGDKKKEKKDVPKEKAQAKEEKPKPAPGPEKPKPVVDPLADLPNGKMVMDDYKKIYFNSPLTKSIPAFWEKFDKEAQSIWKCDYKMEIDSDHAFMLSNLVGGFLQRIEKLRKYALAVMVIAGSNRKDYIVTGIWVWRGQNLVFDLNPDWNVDAPSYAWTKLDTDVPATRELVNAYLAADTDDGFNGRKDVKDVKYYV